MYSRLVKQMAEAEGVNEELKSTDQMVWVQRMNNIVSAGSAQPIWVGKEQPI